MSNQITYKQIEALYCVVVLHGFQAAAEKLHTTQSAVSKRVKDLEISLGITLLDRTGHSAKLTAKGNEFWEVARDLLMQRDLALQRFSAPGSSPGKIRIGMTEITASTWLPRWVQGTRSLYPAAEVCLDVDVAVRISELLNADALDIAVLPQVFLDDRYLQVSLGTLEHVWACVPHMFDSSRAIAATELVDHTLIVQQPQTSATARLLDNWAKARSVMMTKTVRCNSNSASLGMTLSGVGIGYLPKCYAAPYLQSGLLKALTVTDTMPPVVMSAACRPHPADHFVHQLITAAVSVCSFERAL